MASSPDPTAIDWFKAIEKDNEYDAFTHDQAKSCRNRIRRDVPERYLPNPD
jgi:hypothetical protein